jgi:hypothetical protein
MQVKKCSKCGEEKPATLEYFHGDSQANDGFRCYCKKCTKAYYEANKEAIAKRRKAYYKANREIELEQQRAYYETNKEAIAERNKAYYEANKEAILERQKAYQEANKETIAKYSKAYREANKETIAKYSKSHYEANKEAILERSKTYYRTPKGKYVKIKTSANERGIHFSLPLKLYESKLWGKPCHYCGCDIETTGLDRKDSSKGYTPDNVVPCCWDCNLMKGTKLYEEFLQEIKINTCN